MVNYELIGKRIKEIRKRKRISQGKLAEAVDLSEQYISQIETAKRKASLNTVVSIANELEVSVDELLYGNLKIPLQEYSAEINAIYEDCTGYEMRVLFEISVQMKRILRENHDLWERE
ncbi:MAG: helix-turn-helix transcriptional regulator [Eubacteriales bacterium]|nr:helix-turn-helix transcriptional regulator [Eubacteriales bacterium]